MKQTTQRDIDILAFAELELLKHNLMKSNRTYCYGRLLEEFEEVSPTCQIFILNCIEDNLPDYPNAKDYLYGLSR